MPDDPERPSGTAMTATAPPPPGDTRSALRHWLAFLIGDRRAILALVGDRRLLLVGALLTLGAALAREHDAEDLVAEPWHLLLSPLASLAAALAFAALLMLSGTRRWQDPPGCGRIAIAIVAAFWLMAPMAWLYGIPWERLLDPVAAAEANVATLRIVSIWRVALLWRVTVVLTGARPLAAGVLTLGFADLAALAALNAMGGRLVVIMGGVRMDPAQRVVAQATTDALFLTMSGLLILGPALLVVVPWSGRRWTWTPVPGRLRLGGLAALAIVAIVAWGAAAAATWSEQRHARIVRVRVEAGDIAGMMHVLASISAEDLPPQWSPPGLAPGTIGPTARRALIEALAQRRAPPWVLDRYLQRLDLVLSTTPEVDPAALLALLEADAAGARRIRPSDLAARRLLRTRSELPPDLQLRLDAWLRAEDPQATAREHGAVTPSE